MCGIVGYVGEKQASKVLLEGLRRLEYRGYDSAGICIGMDSTLQVLKRKGKIKDLRSIVPDDFPGSFGIGHTRWATHGEVNDVNAHPHTDTTGKIAIVHNGIIENYTSLREMLVSEGDIFVTDTDSEVIAHLIGKYYEGNLEKAVRRAVSLVKGTYGIACVHADEPKRI
ncbi:MAG: glutamine--fructose-6-phosphate aminotransferase, partial [Spirochaetota bacterium]